MAGRPPLVDRREIRSERVSLILSPNNLEALKTLADIKRVTVNELINRLIEAAAKKNASAMAKFKADREAADAAVDLSNNDD